MIPDSIPGTLSCDTLFHPFIGQDVPRLLKERTEDCADHTFLIWAPFDNDVQRWTYGEFYQEVCRLAAGMKAEGVGKGDMVLLHMENCPEFLLTWHACSRLGAIVITTNTRSSEDEMQYFLEDCGASTAITQPKFESLVRKVGPGLKWVAVTETDVGAAPETPRSNDAIPFENLRGDENDAPLLEAEPLARASHDLAPGRCWSRLSAAVPHQCALLLAPRNTLGWRHHGVATQILCQSLLERVFRTPLHVWRADTVHVVCTHEAPRTRSTRLSPLGSGRREPGHHQRYFRHFLPRLVWNDRDDFTANHLECSYAGPRDEHGATCAGVRNSGAP
jgi:hypothetical protein